MNSSAFNTLTTPFSSVTEQPSQQDLKRLVAQAALAFIEEGSILGVGTGSTVNQLIPLLPQKKLKGAVPSSLATEQQLQALGIPIVDLNTVDYLDIYIDGADEVNPELSMIKGGGAALTREKIVASVARQFVCMVDASKRVDTLGKFPLPIEVIPLAKNAVMRALAQLGGQPIHREGVITDNGNIIIDVHGLLIQAPEQLESQINQIVGVVCNGLFAARGADILLTAYAHGIETRSVAHASE